MNSLSKTTLRFLTATVLFAAPLALKAQDTKPSTVIRLMPETNKIVDTILLDKELFSRFDKIGMHGAVDKGTYFMTVLYSNDPKKTKGKNPVAFAIDFKNLPLSRETDRGAVKLNIDDITNLSITGKQPGNGFTRIDYSRELEKDKITITTDKKNEAVLYCSREEANTLVTELLNSMVATANGKTTASAVARRIKDEYKQDQ